MTERVVVGLIFASTGALIALLSLPLIRRRVPPNGWYGLRVPATFADEWVWYEANAKSGRDLATFGVGLTVAGLTLPWARASFHVVAIALAALAVAGALACAAIGWRRANRLLARRRAVGQTPREPG